MRNHTHLELCIDLDLDRCLNLLKLPCSSLRYISIFQDYGSDVDNSYFFRSREFPQSAHYLLHTLPNIGEDPLDKELEFTARSILTTRGNPSFIPAQIFSVKQVAEFIVNQGISCYSIFRNLGGQPDVLLGGINPRTGKTIGQFDPSQISGYLKSPQPSQLQSQTPPPTERKTLQFIN